MRLDEVRPDSEQMRRLAHGTDAAAEEQAQREAHQARVADARDHMVGFRTFADGIIGLRERPRGHLRERQADEPISPLIVMGKEKQGGRVVYTVARLRPLMLGVGLNADHSFHDHEERFGTLVEVFHAMNPPKSGAPAPGSGARPLGVTLNGSPLITNQAEPAHTERWQDRVARDTWTVTADIDPDVFDGRVGDMVDTARALVEALSDTKLNPRRPGLSVPEFVLEPAFLDSVGPTTEE